MREVGGGGPGAVGSGDGTWGLRLVFRNILNYLHMAQRADGESLSRFLQDRELLPYNDAEIARGMGMDRSNFSSYVNGHLPITKSFLRRFYSAFGEELQGIREKKRGDFEDKGVGERLDAVEGGLRVVEEGLRQDGVRLGELEERVERDYDPRLGAVEERLNWLIGEFMKVRG